jgi:hypothetical protein
MSRIAQAGQVALALGRVMPPRPRRLALHEAHRRDEGVDDARVMTLTGADAQLAIHRVGVALGQGRRRGDADQAQVGGNGWADVGDLLEAGAARSRVGFHGLAYQL